MKEDDEVDEEHDGYYYNGEKPEKPSRHQFLGYASAFPFLGKLITSSPPPAKKREEESELESFSPSQEWSLSVSPSAEETDFDL